MYKFTDEQLFEFYGLRRDKVKNTLVQSKNWKPDFTKWIAVVERETQEDLEEGEEPESEFWCIAPKPFWYATGFIPDDSLGFDVPGFEECVDHTLKPSKEIENPEKSLRKLGFTIIKNAEWGRASQPTETEVTIVRKPKRILKKRDLLTAIANFPDDDDIVIQIHDDSIPEGQTGVPEDLYPFFVEHVRVDDNLGEIRLMLLPND